MCYIPDWLTLGEFKLWLFDIVNGQGTRKGFPFRSLNSCVLRGIAGLTAPQGAITGQRPRCYKTMTNTTHTIEVQIGKVRFYYKGSAKKPSGKGKPSFKIVLLTLVVFAVIVALGTAAFAGDHVSFTSVSTVWNEIKPILVLLLKSLK
jgi:hypothetical protein